MLGTGTGMERRRPLLLDINFLCGKYDEEQYFLPSPGTPPTDGSQDKEARTTCNMCMKRLSSLGNLRVHMRVVHGASKDYECEMCFKKFGTKNNMQRHIDMVHRKQRPYECLQCRRRFLTKSCVKRHQNSFQKCKTLQTNHSSFMLISP
ncbi:hypothetical protein NDN08_002948 [Rhodosorus marinus]|uniref:C2H2-type domain-containing protein n=1 Tax=Rhodosorus marinus TaxID=101924 RepID=A0AAV8UV54_9RHOD|nr:hypothetical protein NDN08_002948 [Rhodosorus marinus]